MSASVRIEKVIGRLTTIEKVMPVIGDTTDNGHPFEYMQVRVKQLCQFVTSIKILYLRTRLAYYYKF